MNITQDLNIDYTKFKLPNGIKCILYPRNEIHSVSIRVNINVGSLDEDKENRGLSHFIEHVVHDGTKDLPTWDAVENFKTEYSAATNAYTSIDHTQYYGTFPFQYFEQAISYFAQIVLHPLFAESEINKERDIIIDEMKSYEDETEFKIMRNIKENRFVSDTTPFSSEILGIKENLEKYTRQSLYEFWEKYYSPENIEIYIIGNFEVEDAKKLLNKMFYEEIKDRKSVQTQRLFRTEYPEYTNFKINAKQKAELDKYYLTFTFPGYEFRFRDIEKRQNLSFLKAITASTSYFQSVLWKKLRQELGIVYGVYSWDYDMHSRGLFVIETSFEKDHLQTVLEEFKKGIDLIKTGEVTDLVFNYKKKKILDTQLMQLDRPENALSWISTYEDELEEHGKGMMISDYLSFVQNLNFDSIIKTANEIFDWDKLNIGIVSTDDSEVVEKQVNDIWLSL